LVHLFEQTATAYVLLMLLLLSFALPNLAGFSAGPRTLVHFSSSSTDCRSGAGIAPTDAKWSPLGGQNTLTLYDICMVDGGNGWIVGWSADASGAALRWDGTLWSSVPVPADNRLFAVDMVNSNDGWAMGDPGAAIRWNGTWWMSAGYLDQYVYGLSMVNFYDGWAVGAWGEKMHRWNGVKWNEVTTPSSSTLNAVHMLGANDGWAVGSWGSILQWNGTLWSNMTSPAHESAHLYDVHGISSDDVWAVGNFGVVIHWNGTVWSVVRDPEDPYENYTWLFGLDMVDANEGWAVGYAGRIMHWNGSIWEDVPSPSENDLMAVSMVNATDGWAVGKQGTIIHWNGTLWEFPKMCDLTVTNVETSKDIVGQGFTVAIDATLRNQGLFAETFNATIYANGKRVSDLTDITIPADSQATCQGVWNTSGWARGNYSIAVYVFPLAGEVDTSNNIYTASRDVIVTIPGDVEADYDVDIYDIVILASAYDTQQGQAKYKPNCDLDGDGDIDIYDIIFAAGNYGKRWQSKHRNFVTSVQANTMEGLSWYPVIAADGLGGVYATWRHIYFDEDTNRTYEPILCIHSHDYGRTWSNESIVNDNADPSTRCSTPSIAVDEGNGNIYVAWLDNRTGRSCVYIDKSVDYGLSFGSDTKVNDDNGDVYNPGGMYWVNVAVADNGKVYVGWEDRRADPAIYRPDIYFASSDDSATTFGLNTRVNPPDNTSCHRWPWIATTDNGVVYVAYTNQEYPFGGADVLVARSLDEGFYFETPVKVNDDSTGGYRGKKELTVSSSGNVYVVWTDGRAGAGTYYWDIYLAVSLDCGLSFGRNVRVNDDPPGPADESTIQGTPSLAIDSEEGIHVVWEDFRNYGVPPTHYRDIYYSYSADGYTFSRNTAVNSYPNATYVLCADPSMEIDADDNLYVIWTDIPQGGYYLYFGFSQAFTP